MPAPFALISVPDPAHVIGIASVLQSTGYDILTDASMDLLPLRDNNIACARSGRALPEIQISSLEAVVISLPDLRGGELTPDPLSYERCALLVRAASSARKILTVPQRSDYTKVISELMSPASAVSEKTRLELCCWSMQIASTWLSHASRYWRRQIELLQPPIVTAPTVAAESAAAVA